MNKWNSVDNERPQRSVLLYAGVGKYTYMIQGFYDSDDEEWYDDLNGEIIYHVSHWMELPEKPSC